MTNAEFQQATVLMLNLVEEHGLEKATKVIECIRAIMLALSGFDQETGKAALAFMFDTAGKMMAAKGKGK
jgi:hypothetical protein